ncbi:hypothetical protein [Olleya sp. HaHaR_3_96]|uniref:hypothetical protein n=1 Tax=Olleya sp. HaHaR_3_96 TaxID=2745560 RepID=UPI001C4F9818|nr:hypothetical protein [Olleya sp. HaHaR_3_96]QXP58572.1 hypothetical protein H0I26_11650 [Olleya sp. HaHaR_3_96]
MIGIIFIGLGGSRVAMDKGGLAFFGGMMALYGIFSLGYGIYMLINTKENNHS